MKNERGGGRMFSVEELDLMSNEVKVLKERCMYFRTLLDKGSSKLDAVLKIIRNIHARELEIKEMDGDAAVLQQMNEQQINDFLEMLKSPSFQNVARQFLLRFVNAQS